MKRMSAVLLILLLFSAVAFTFPSCKKQAGSAGTGVSVSGGSAVSGPSSESSPGPGSSSGAVSSPADAGAPSDTAITMLAPDTQQKSAAASSFRSLDEEAAKLHSTPGRVALAILINRLDDVQPVEKLASKNAENLFSEIEVLAPQKSKTLESLDRLYGLRDILASEKIYVRIQANDVVSVASAAAANKNWKARFESAVNSQN